MSISDNIRRLRKQSGLTQSEFGEIAGVTDRAVSAWEKGIAEPRIDTIQKLATHFDISKGAIVDDVNDHKEEVNNKTYYLDPKVVEIAQEVYEHPELKLLFEASRKVSAEDLKAIIYIANRLKKNEK